MLINPDKNLARNPFFARSLRISLSSCAKPASIVSTSFSVGESPVGSVADMVYPLYPEVSLEAILKKTDYYESDLFILSDIAGRILPTDPATALNFIDIVTASVLKDNSPISTDMLVNCLSMLARISMAITPGATLEKPLAASLMHLAAAIEEKPNAVAIDEDAHQVGNAWGYVLNVISDTYMHSSQKEWEIEEQKRLLSAVLQRRDNQTIIDIISIANPVMIQISSTLPPDLPDPYRKLKVIPTVDEVLDRLYDGKGGSIKGLVDKALELQ